MAIQVLILRKIQSLGRKTDLHIPGVRGVAPKMVQVILKENPDITGLHTIGVSVDTGQQLPPIHKQNTEKMGDIGEAEIMGWLGGIDSVGHMKGKILGGLSVISCGRFQRQTPPILR